MNKIKSYRILSIIILIIILIDSGLCIFSINVTRREIANMEQIVNANIQKNECLNDFEEATAYLTEQAREYVRTYNPVYMEKYFEEFNSIKRREKAVEDFAEAGGSASEIYLLNVALKKSNELANSEIRAMAIVSKLIAYDKESLPQQIKDYEFNEAEQRASIDELKSLASKVVYGNNYEKEKKEVITDIEKIAELIRINTNQASEDSVSNTNNVITMLSVYVVILVVVIVFALGFVIFAISKKINKENLTDTEKQI